MQVDRPTVFIGSSSEGYNVAEAVKAHLEDEADVFTWKDDVFKLNHSALDSLLNAAGLYDFAVLIFTPDDVLKSRGKSYKSARDNILFEHGLFLGRLGPRRAYILCEKSVKILTDFKGITISLFELKKGSSIKKDLKEVCDSLKKEITRNFSYAELGMLPSTALAIGYYENFISKVVPYLLEGKYEIESGGEKLKAAPFDSFIFHIVIPKSINYVEKNNLQGIVKENKLYLIKVKTPIREFPFYIRAAIKEKNLLTLYDFPTTLISSKRAIDLNLQKGFIGKTMEEKKLEQREIRNFRITLEHLLRENHESAFGKSIVLISPDELNE